VFQSDDDLVVDGNATADKAGVAALWHDREPARVAMSQDIGNLGGGTR
tara:strand:+ start:477 stop:620 length:144 start_codon:yes stop_codon:yes gene_type:complete